MSLLQQLPCQNPRQVIIQISQTLIIAINNYRGKNKNNLSEYSPYTTSQLTEEVSPPQPPSLFAVGGSTFAKKHPPSPPARRLSHRCPPAPPLATQGV